MKPGPNLETLSGAALRYTYGARVILSIVLSMGSVAMGQLPSNKAAILRAKSDREAIDEMYPHHKKKEKGKIHYVVPVSMNMEAATIVPMEIEGPQFDSKMAPLNDRNLKEVTDTCYISEYASVSLTSEDPEAFTILDLAPESLPKHRHFQADTSNTWRWQVTPHKNGTYHLIVEGFTSVWWQGQMLPPESCYTKVESVMVPSESFYKRLRSYIATLVKEHSSELLKWCWTVLLVPFFAWLWKKTIRKRRGTDTHESDTTKQQQPILDRELGTTEN